MSRQIQREKLSPLAMRGAEHWKEHRPQMFKELMDEGQLETEVQRAADKTNEMLDSLMGQGMPYHQAWEMVREEFLFLPEEEGASEEPPESEGYRILVDAQREYSRIMREQTEMEADQRWREARAREKASKTTE